MAAVECDSKDNDSAVSSKTSVFTNEAVKTFPENESPDIPLQTAWTFWLDKAIPGITVEEYTADLTKIYTVKTVQCFWAVFNNIPNAGSKRIKCSYHLMRDERYPLWEEPINENGGTWRLKCHKSDTEKVWKEVVVAAIGEQFAECVADGDDVCGVTVSIRDKDDLIQIWNIDAGLAQKATIFQKVHQLVPDVLFVGEFYKAHRSHHAYGKH